MATVAAYFFMDNLGTAKSSPREQLQVVKQAQTWVMSFLYIGTFGSFIGYSAAMPLLIKLNFWVPSRRPGIGIYFAYYAFLGAAGRLGDPAVRRLAGRPYGGAKVTLGAFVAMIACTLAVLWTSASSPPPGPADHGDRRPGVGQPRGSRGSSGFFLCVFAATGIGNGSTYKMIPAIFGPRPSRATTPDPASARPRPRRAPSRPRPRSASSARWAPSAGS